MSQVIDFKTRKPIEEKKPCNCPICSGQVSVEIVNIQEMSLVDAILFMAGRAAAARNKKEEGEKK